VGELVDEIRKVVPPKDLGSIVYPNTWHYSLKQPAPGMNLHVLGTF
jgi:hypothetical protein